MPGRLAGIHEHGVHGRNRVEAGRISGLITDAARSLRPTGVELSTVSHTSTRAGTECVAHALQVLTEMDPMTTIVSIDGVGACDSISRKATFASSGVGSCVSQGSSWRHKCSSASSAIGLVCLMPVMQCTSPSVIRQETEKRPGNGCGRTSSSVSQQGTL